MNIKIQEEIKSAIYDRDYEMIEFILTNYEEKYPHDRDILYYRIIFNLYKGELKDAYELACIGIRKYPTSVKMNYLMACVYDESQNLLKSLEYYNIALFLAHKIQYEDKDGIVQDVQTRIDILTENLEDYIEIIRREKNIEKIREVKKFYARYKSSVWGKDEINTRNDENKIIGTEYWVTSDEKRFIGLYRYPFQGFLKKENMNLIHSMGEFLKTTYAKEYMIEGVAEEYLLPIASIEASNIHKFYEKGNNYNIYQQYPNQFNYYRVKNNTNVISEKMAHYGQPIALGHSDNRKKLVLNIFVDGLAQEVIKGKEFEVLMPNTYRFFKEGIICTNVHSCSEWTYPSLATYISGHDTLGHMLFHPTIDGELPKDTFILSEYFKEKGYYTTKLDGSWRSAYTYGYIRGIDQYLYQHQWTGGRAEQEVANIIEHIDSFKDTDLYCWMLIADLHDIADELDLCGSVQTQLTLEERDIEDKAVTSVKLKYSKKKIGTYKKCIKHLDMVMESLYHYILMNYKENEIIISLFSDHGQGYLVPEEKHFLSSERTNVAFMFRGNLKRMVSNELISTADYLPIMCKLANIEVKGENIEGRLPRIFGGIKDREYVITESIHPHDMYCAALRTKDFTIYFNNNSPVNDEGRFYLQDTQIFGFYNNGNKLEDIKILNKYEKILIERIKPYLIYD